MSKYSLLYEHFGRVGRLDEAIEALHWDTAVMMPAGGSSARAEQMATLEGLCHGLKTESHLVQWFEQAEQEDLDPWQSANLKEMRRQHLHATAVPADLVEALSRAGSACETRWRTARAADDFKALEPLLTEVVSLVRHKAQAKSEALGCHPYEALMDLYEPGASIKRLDAIFGDLAAFLPEFTEAVLERQANGPGVIMPEGPFAVELQKALGLEVMKVLGFDFEHGRLDVSHHPFCAGSPDDVRITTRYSTGDFVQSLMGVIHETGHALYERGLPAGQWRFQPVAHARGMGMHESQSLLMEMQACRSRHFLSFLAPKVREIFSGQGPAWTTENLQRLYGKVERGLIRVDADEVTYPAHVILRYRLEKALLADELQVVDLPEAWRQGMAELVGVTPENDRDGCMQDIHWMDGSLGYFPTYTLGAMTAAQLFDAACRQLPQIPEEISKGNFAPLLGWLGPNVHAVGSSKSTEEILIDATGQPLNVQIFKDHLQRRYLP